MRRSWQSVWARWNVAVVLIGLFSGCTDAAKLGRMLDFGLGYNKGYAPDQPIPFSHKFHAGELKVDCRYCHGQAYKAEFASVPAVSVCMNCHTAIRQAGGEASPHIDRLVDAYQNGKSIEWVRVHMLPDHARFNHGAHMNAGVNCTHCHGQIQEMEKVQQVSTLSMGWCISCHRENDTGRKAPETCQTCHY